MFSITRWWKRNFSKTPWVEIVAAGIESDGHIKIEFDWNKPFIDNLKKNGFRYDDDDECVRAWFQTLTNERLAKILDDLDKERDEAGSTYVPTDNHPNLDNPGKIIQ